MAHFEHRGARVVNGSAALALDTSKARQLSLFRAMGLDVPATRCRAPFLRLGAAAAQLRFPVMVKGDIGGSGAGMARYGHLGRADLLRRRTGFACRPERRHAGQEYVPAQGARVIRCETLGGRFLNAIALDGAGSTFDLCPADVCMVDKPSISISAFKPAPPDRALGGGRGPGRPPGRRRDRVHGWTRGDGVAASTT